MKNACHVCPLSDGRIASIRYSSRDKSWDLYVDDDLIQRGFVDAQEAASHAQQCDFPDETAKIMFAGVHVSDDLNSWRFCNIAVLREAIEERNAAKSQARVAQSISSQDRGETSFAD
jgi:hypothetical protein